MADDPIRSEARVLSDHLDALGCSIVADEFQSARSHDDLDWVKLKCLELLKAATQSGTALDDLLRLLEVDWDAWERREEARRDAAKAAGARARAAGLISAKDVALLEELRSIDNPFAESLEMCTSQRDVDKLLRLLGAGGEGGDAAVTRPKFRATKGVALAPISLEHAELLNRYRRHQVRRDLTESSVYALQGRLRGYLRGLEAEQTTVFQATRRDVETFLDRRRTANGQTISGRTRYHWISAIHSFYVWAIGEGLTQADPTAAIIRPKQRRVLPRPIDGDALSDAIRGAQPQMRAMLLLAGFAGLRCQEIAGLERDDILEAKGLIRVRHGKGRKERIVPLHPEVIEALRALPMPRSGYLFRRAMGGRHSPETMSVAIRTYLRQDCGIDATAHQLRHFFASEVYAASKDIRVTQELLGHSNPSTTAGYVAFSHVDAASAVGSLRLGNS